MNKGVRTVETKNTEEKLYSYYHNQMGWKDKLLLQCKASSMEEADAIYRKALLSDPTANIYIAIVIEEV